MEPTIGIADRLKIIADLLQEGKASPSITVRDFLSWFGAQRRGGHVVWWIRYNLKKAGLETDPEFEAAYLDSPITFVLFTPPEDSDDVGSKDSTPTTVAIPTSATGQTNAVYADPTHRISKLAAANKSPTSVPPDATIQQATTIMLTNDFSQLPVMTTDRDVKGVISWVSIGTRLVLGKGGSNVRHFMDGHQEIRIESSLFQAIPIIAQHQYVLVRGSDGRIAGIVTGTDLNLQFQQLAEPFLLLDEIENYIRRLLGDRYSPEELASVRDPSDDSRTINDVADLTFGEYIRLLEKDERWKKLNIQIDRAIFCKSLDQVRRIRNDVMHFDPDGIPQADLERLREFVGFLQMLQAVGAL